MGDKAKRPIVFISYSHDSKQHKETVLRLYKSLRRDGCNCKIDVHKDDGQDWPGWMSNQLIQSDFVLCVVTETYEKRFRHQGSPDEGLGVGWEAVLIRTLLYEKKLHNNWIFPIYLSENDKLYVPLELKSPDVFPLLNADQYETLLRKLLDKPKYTKPALGSEPDLPPEPIDCLFSRPDNNPQATNKAQSAKLPPRHISRITQLLDAESLVIKAFEDRLHIKPDASSNQANIIVEELFELNNKQAIACLYDIYEKLCRQGMHDAAANVSAIAEAWLPVVIGNDHDIEEIKGSLGQQKLLDIPANMPIVLESILAEVEQGLVNLKLSETDLVSGFNLGKFGELGLNENGQETKKEMARILATRFQNPGDDDQIIGSIGRIAGGLGNIGDDSETVLQKKVNVTLEALKRLYNRSYYICLNNREPTKSVSETLNQLYPILTFVVNTCTEDEILNELELFRDLKLIIAHAKGDTSICQQLSQQG